MDMIPCMNKTMATYKAYLKDLHSCQGEYTVVDDHMLVRSINSRRFSAIFSTTSRSLAINELPGRSTFTLAMMVGPS